MKIGGQIQCAQIFEGREAADQWQKDIHAITSRIVDPEFEKDCGRKRLFKNTKQLEQE